MGAVRAATMQGAAAAAVPEGGGASEAEGQNEPSAAGRRRRRPRRQGSKASDAGAVAANGTPETWPPTYTTAMLRNIPNRYAAEELLAEIIAAGFESTFDFFYLPIDLTSKRNRGYAFINFRTGALASEFVRTFDKERLTRYSTQKILMIMPALTQGLGQNLHRFDTMGTKRIRNAWFRPMAFLSDDEVDSEGASEASERGQDSLPEID